MHNLNMDLYAALNKVAPVPVPHHLLINLLSGYKRPNDKIHELIRQGVLIPLKKGLYAVGSKIHQVLPEPMLVANHLYGPSYVSMQYALGYYGLLPEQVTQITSATTKPNKKFTNKLGLFAYIKLPLPYFALGVTFLTLNEKQTVMIARPEKALCDVVATTKGLILRSKKEAQRYLFEDLRMDTGTVNNLNRDEMETYLHSSPKKNSLAQLSKAMKLI